MDAHHTNAPRRLTASEIYGEVEYFVKHEYDGSDRIFAYIQKLINMRQIIMAKYILVNLVVYNLLKL